VLHFRGRIDIDIGGVQPGRPVVEYHSLELDVWAAEGLKVMFQYHIDRHSVRRKARRHIQRLDLSLLRMGHQGAHAREGGGEHACSQADMAYSQRHVCGTVRLAI
jgi:hypothetical protein